MSDAPAASNCSGPELEGFYDAMGPRLYRGPKDAFTRAEAALRTAAPEAARAFWGITQLRAAIASLDPTNSNPAISDAHTVTVGGEKIDFELIRREIQTISFQNTALRLLVGPEPSESLSPDASEQEQMVHDAQWETHIAAENHAVRRPIRWITEGGLQALKQFIRLREDLEGAIKLVIDSSVIHELEHEAEDEFNFGVAVDAYRKDSPCPDLATELAAEKADEILLAALSAVEIVKDEYAAARHAA